MVVCNVSIEFLLPVTMSGFKKWCLQSEKCRRRVWAYLCMLEGAGSQAGVVVQLTEWTLCLCFKPQLCWWRSCGCEEDPKGYASLAIGGPGGLIILMVMAGWLVVPGHPLFQVFGLCVSEQGSKQKFLHQVGSASFLGGELTARL